MPVPIEPAAARRIQFDWNATHHFAAVSYLRRRSKRGVLRTAATILAVLAAVLAFLHFAGGGLSYEHAAQLLVFLAAFSMFTAIFAWRPVRRFFVRLFVQHGSAVPCAIEFDEGGVAWTIGDRSRLWYPWAKVRSVDQSSEYVFVAASSAACVAIPKSAFASPLEADRFAAAMRQRLGR